MKLFFKSYFLLSLFIFSIQIQASAYTELTVTEQSAASAVWMLQTNMGGGSGSGFFIAPNRIVTNFHVIVGLLKIGKLENIKLRQENGDGLVDSDIKITKILALSVTADLAVLETDQSTETYLTINTNQITPETQDLFSLGYPKKRFSKVSQTGPLQILSNRFFFSVDMDTIQGASGSPVLNTENEVVGVVSEGQIHWQSSIQAKQLASLIDGNIDFGCGEYDTKTCINKTLESNREEAEQGIVEAQYRLSKYLQKTGVTEDRAEGVKLLQKAADKNYAPAQFKIGLMYFKEGNMDKAIEWMKKAGEQDYSLALNFLVEIYLFGRQVAQNMEEAVYWIQKAVNQDNVTSQYYFGMMYFSGNGVEQNNIEAFSWTQKAALQNHAPAQYLLAGMYFYGNGVEQNTRTAAEFLLKAAMQDYVPAQRKFQGLLENPSSDKEIRQIFQEVLEEFTGKGTTNK